MKGFKDLAFEDIKHVFFNSDEFGEQHFIDGNSMTVIIDGLEVVDRSKKQADQGRIDGIYKKQILIYVSKCEFGPLPIIGRELKLDRNVYRVMDAIDEGGVYSITLGAIKS